MKKNALITLLEKHQIFNPELEKVWQVTTPTAIKLKRNPSELKISQLQALSREFGIEIHFLLDLCVNS